MRAVLLVAAAEALGVPRVAISVQDDADSPV